MDEILSLVNHAEYRLFLVDDQEVSRSNIATLIEIDLEEMGATAVLNQFLTDQEFQTAAVSTVLERLTV